MSTSHCEPGIMGRHVIPALGEPFIQMRAHNFPELISSIPRKSPARASVFHVYLPGWVSLPIEELRTYLRFFWDKVYQNKHTQIYLSYPQGTWAFSWNLLSLKSEALRTFQTLCVLSSLACLKAWWTLSILLYWKDTEIFSLQWHTNRWHVPSAGKVSVCTIRYYMLLKKCKETNRS